MFYCKKILYIKLNKKLEIRKFGLRSFMSFDQGVNPTKLFFHFLLLSLSVFSMRKYHLYFEITKLKSENWKNEEIKVW
jgi:hypothetical protein